MSTVELTKDNFESTIEENDIVLVDFWADWCGPCKAFAPVFEKAAETHTDIVFAKLNTEDQPDLAGAFRISAIPTLMAFREGVPVFAQPGLLPGPVLDELVEKIRALDMDEVREKVRATA